MTAAATKAAFEQSRNKRYIQRHGCTYEQYKTIPSKARVAYAVQKTGAKRRGIEWLFSKWSWWCVWRDSGLWDKRGKEVGCYVMGRFNDVGPYSPDNVEIVLASENTANGREGTRKARSRLVGIRRKKMRYGDAWCVVVKRSHVGTFRSLEEAIEAQKKFNTA